MIAAWLYSLSEGEFTLLLLGAAAAMFAAGHFATVWCKARAVVKAGRVTAEDLARLERYANGEAK